jgi:histidine triad (HIT) family protein
MKQPCPFCGFDGNILIGTRHAFLISPLNPVNDGHFLVIPRKHYRSALDVPGRVMNSIFRCVAAETSGGSYNLIVNQGAPASQTVEHVHWHLLLRAAGDGVVLPWTGQKIS